MTPKAPRQKQLVISDERDRHRGLATKPDWSFKDGAQGFLSEKQAEAVEMMAQVCEDVRKALRLLGKKP